MATCWLLGALAAKAYEREGLVRSNQGSYAPVVTRVVKAGAAACGVLILATQVDLWMQYGYVQLGDSPETDFRLYQALVEVVNDIFFEAVCLLTWRLFLAKQSASNQ